MKDISIHVKVINVDTDELVEEKEMNDIVDLQHIHVEHPGCAIIFGKKNTMSDVVGLRRAYHDINKINVDLDEDKQFFANYYFAILKEDNENNSKEHPVVVFILSDHWHRSSKDEVSEYFEDPNSLEMDILSPLSDRFDNERGFIYVANEYEGRKEENELYDDLLDMGFSFCKDFDDFINEELTI